ncbi:MAG: TIGR03067 domain-containing protein [Opitutaceae bacterium]
MAKHLPARPNLDHLRRQAKALLTALASREPAAISTILKHLPAAKGVKPADVLAMRLRLADAQSALARQNGFAGWPHLARHVEQLRALEGQWEFARLEVDGSAMPAGALATSRILIDGDRFRTDSPGAIYEGTFNIDVETQPHAIDIEFIAGPEAGNWNYGIFRLEGDQLEICLDLNGKPRPPEFRTSPGSGRAYETLKRASHARPEGVTGGTASAARPAPVVQDRAGFEFVASPTLAKLQGQWTAVKIVQNGEALPSMMLRTGLRTAEKNEIRVLFAGQTVIHALVRIDEGASPVTVDYYNLDGPLAGTIQHGLFEWSGDTARFCMSGMGQPRPADFTCPAGSGHTLSEWRPKK